MASSSPYSFFNIVVRARNMFFMEICHVDVWPVSANSSVVLVYTYSGVGGTQLVEHQCEVRSAQ